MVLRSSPMEPLESPNVTHSPNTQHTQRIRKILYTILTPFLLEGCGTIAQQEEITPDKEEITVQEVIDQKDPLFSEIADNASVLNTMIRFTLPEEKSASIGVFIKGSSLLIKVKSDDFNVPETTYTVQKITAQEKYIDAKNVKVQTSIGFLDLIKKEDEIHGAIPFVGNVHSIHKDIFYILLHQIMYDNKHIDPQENTYYSLSYKNEQLTIFMQPKTTP